MVLNHIAIVCLGFVAKAKHSTARNKRKSCASLGTARSGPTRKHCRAHGAPARQQAGSARRDGLDACLGRRRGLPWPFSRRTGRSGDNRGHERRGKAAPCPARRRWRGLRHRPRGRRRRRGLRGWQLAAGVVFRCQDAAAREWSSPHAVLGRGGQRRRTQQRLGRRGATLLGVERRRWLAAGLSAAGRPGTSSVGGHGHGGSGAGGAGGTGVGSDDKRRAHDRRWSGRRCVRGARATTASVWSRRRDGRCGRRDGAGRLGCRARRSGDHRGC